MKKKKYETPAISITLIEMAGLIAASAKGSIHVYDNDDDAWEEEL